MSSKAAGFVAEGDLRALIEAFLRQPFLQGKLTEDRATHVHRLRLGENGRRELVSRVQALDVAGSQSAQFARAVEAPGETALTFDQQTAASRRDLEFVTPVHPLARAASATGPATTSHCWARSPWRATRCHQGYTSSRARCGRPSPSARTSGSYAWRFGGRRSVRTAIVPPVHDVAACHGPWARCGRTMPLTCPSAAASRNWTRCPMPGAAGRSAT